MPIHPDGYLIPFTEEQIEAMELKSADVRRGANPTETREIGQSTYRRTWQCTWESAYDACELIFGDEVEWTNSGTKEISRLLPDPTYGRNPYKPEIVATKLESLVGFGRCMGVDEFNVPIYPKALLTVLYEHVPYALAEDDEIYPDGTEFDRYTYFDGAHGSVQNITIPGGAMRFWQDPDEGTGLPNGVPVPYGVSVTRSEEEFIYNFVRLPYDSFKPGSILYERVYGTVEGDLSFMGCVNKEPIFNRAAGTVILTGITPLLQRAHTGEGRRWSLGYKFAYSSFGWNWLYYPDPTGVNSGWFNVNNKEFQAADTLEDHRSLTPGARDLNLLFSVS